MIKDFDVGDKKPISDITDETIGTCLVGVLLLGLVLSAHFVPQYLIRLLAP